MISVRSFLSFPLSKKDTFLHILLIAMTIIVAFNANGTMKETGKLVASLQLVFIISHLSHYKGLQALANLYKKHNLILWFALLWLVSSTLSTLYATLFEHLAHSQIRTTIYRETFVIVHVLFILSCSSFLLNAGIQVSSYFKVFGFCLLAILLYYSWLINMEPPRTADEWFRSPPLFRHIREVGWFAAIGFAFSTNQYLSATSCKRFDANNIFWASVAIASLSLILWTGGRAVIFSAFVCLCLLLARNFHRSPIAIRTALRLALMVVCSLLIAKSLTVAEWNGLDRILGTTYSITTTTPGQVSADSLTTGRAHMWSAALNAVKDNPLLGLGPNGYSRILPRLYGMQPHNIVVQVLVEWGVIGALLITPIGLFLIIRCIKILFKSENADLVSASLVVLILSLNSFFSGTLFYSYPVFFFCLALSACLAFPPPEASKQKSFKPRLKTATPSPYMP